MKRRDAVRCFACMMRSGWVCEMVCIMSTKLSPWGWRAWKQEHKENFEQDAGDEAVDPEIASSLF